MPEENAGTQESRPDAIQERAFLHVPKFVWGIAGSVFLFISIAMSMKVADFPIGEIARSYIEIDLRESEIEGQIRLARLRGEFGCDGDSVNFADLISGLTRRVIALERVSHSPVKTD